MAAMGCYPEALRFFHSQHLYPIFQGPEALPTASFCQWEETLIWRSLTSEASGLTAEFWGSNTSHRSRKSEEDGRARWDPIHLERAPGSSLAPEDASENSS